MLGHICPCFISPQLSQRRALKANIGFNLQVLLFLFNFLCFSSFIRWQIEHLRIVFFLFFQSKLPLTSINSSCGGAVRILSFFNEKQPVFHPLLRWWLPLKTKFSSNLSGLILLWSANIFFPVSYTHLRAHET